MALGSFSKRLEAKKREREYRQMAVWALRQVAIENGSEILDIGCGEGITIELEHDRNYRGTIWGIDVSETGLAKARSLNGDAVAAGTVRLYKAGVAHLPFDDQSFNLVVSVSRTIFWARTERNLQEIYRVMKNGGTAMLCWDDQAEKWETGLVGRGETRSPEKMHALMKNVGFLNVTLEQKGDWRCLVGGKL